MSRLFLRAGRYFASPAVGDDGWTVFDKSSRRINVSYRAINHFLALEACTTCSTMQVSAEEVSVR